MRNRFFAITVLASLGFIGARSGDAFGYGTGTCSGHCGGASTDCYCDSACSSYGDCCGDYAAACTGTAGVSVTTYSSALDVGSTADIFVNRGNDEVTHHIIPGFFTHSGIKDLGTAWMHSLGHVDGGWFDCPLGFFGGVKYESQPQSGQSFAGSAVFHVTNVSDAQRMAAADFSYFHYRPSYPFAETSGYQISGDSEQTYYSNPTYCSVATGKTNRSNYDWAWIDTRTNDRPYCSSMVHWSYAGSVNRCGTTRNGAGIYKPLYNHAAEFGPNCVWLGDYGDGFDGDLCDAGGGQEGWDAAGHFLGWVQGENEPNEDSVESTCKNRTYGQPYAITPSELVENHVWSGYTQGYFAFQYNY